MAVDSSREGFFTQQIIEMLKLAMGSAWGGVGVRRHSLMGSDSTIFELLHGDNPFPLSLIKS